MKPPGIEDLDNDPDDDPRENVFHVYPEHAGRKHSLNDEYCWCDPEVEVNTGGKIVTHRNP